jgi:hypothetical protein
MSAVLQLDRSDLFGLMAEFDQAEELLAAARRVYAAGYRRIDAYTPIPVEGLSEALGARATRLPFLTLLGGVLGAVAGYALQYWASVIAYPLNVGGRPLNSWPAFVPVIFELAILGAALFSVLGMLALNGLPMPYHPVFNVPEFKLASRDRFFLAIESRDPQFDPSATHVFLAELRPRAIHEVPR